jgi:hypothetical protein
LVDYRALAGKVAGLVATGGSDRHAVVIEHQLRPLFGFFGVQTLATGVFILDKTIVNGQVDAAGWLSPARSGPISPIYLILRGCGSFVIVFGTQAKLQSGP